MARNQPSLSDLVRLRREAAGFSSISAAVAASQKTKTPVPKGTWVEIENGTNTNPKIAALLGIAATVKCRVADLLEATPAHAVRRVELFRVFPNPNNVRRTPATEQELDALTASIKKDGLLQPILVRPFTDPSVKGEAFEIVMGENRWRASVRAFTRQGEIDIIVRDVSDDELAMLMLAENMQRIEMHPLDVADALARAAKDHPTADLVASTGKSKRWVQEYVSVGNHLCPGARDMVQKGQLTISNAILLASIKDEALQETTAVYATMMKEDALREHIAGLKGKKPPEDDSARQTDIEDRTGKPKQPPRSSEPRDNTPPPPPPPAASSVPGAAPPPASPRADSPPGTQQAAGNITRPIARSLAWDMTGALAEGSFHAVVFGPAGGPAKHMFSSPTWGLLCAEVEQHFPNSDFLHSQSAWTKNALDEPVFAAFGDVVVMRTDGL